MEGKILHILYKSAYRVYIPVMLANIFIAILASDNVDRIWWASWTILITTVVLTRTLLITRIIKATDIGESKKLRLIQYMFLASGISQGLSSLFFPFLEPYERSIITMIMAGFCLGNIFTNAGYRPLFYSFTAPTMLPITLMWIVSAKGSTGWVEYSVAAITFAYTAILFTFARDIFQTFKESYNIRLEQVKLNKELEKALRNEESANAAKTRFLASASHDLRQPLNTMAIYSAALNLQNLDKKSRQIASQINHSQEILSNQLDSLLDISKLDSGTITIERSDFDLRQLLSHIISGFIPEAQTKGMHILLEQHDDIRLHTDKYQFERIINNLLSNAVRHNDNNDIHIKSQESENICTIEIIDAGQGIPESEMDKIFEEFYQVNNPERDRSQGLGLGLSIVKRLCGLLDIAIDIRSTVGTGTHITLTVPRSSGLFIDNTILSEAVSDSVRGVNILFVDDEEMARKGMSELLAELKAHVSTAGGTGEAVKLARETRPDIVLADLRLRGVDNGIRTIDEIRKLYPGLPAIIITGDIYGQQINLVKARNLPFLRKPLDANRLISMINSYFQ